MKKSILILLSFLLGAVLLAGCSCEHVWTEATCTEPKVCTKCSQAEGEALGHSWEEPDCITPKTCSRCAFTEGTPLGHQWKEATCTTAKTCTLCGLTEGQPLDHVWEGEATLYAAPFCNVCGTDGEPLPGYLAQNGLVPNLFPGQTADYITNTFVRPDLDTTGSLLVSDLQIFDYDSTHRTRIGYEWRRADISIRFSDSRSGLYGTRVAFARADYYQDQKLQPGKTQESFTVTYQGKDYPCQAFYENSGFYFDGSSNVYDLTCYFQVPEGYDGVVLAFHHGSLSLEGRHLHEAKEENMLLLRLA